MSQEEEVDPTLRKDVFQAIEKGQVIKVRLYGLLSKAEQELLFVLNSILKHFGRADLVDAAYTAVKELALNGAKANFKHVLFEELKLSIDDEEQYEQGMEEFRSKLSEKWVFEYANKCREHELFVDVVFNFNGDTLVVEVVNNRALSPREDKRVREKFREGNRYDSIAEFYMDNHDNSEGAGMGITLILMLLKAEGIDPESFTIENDSEGNSTSARVEFPLSGVTA